MTITAQVLDLLSDATPRTTSEIAALVGITTAQAHDIVRYMVHRGVIASAERPYIITLHGLEQADARKARTQRRLAKDAKRRPKKAASPMARVNSVFALGSMA
jgi:DNA-binding IclR family transcriptional regulator